MYLKKGNQISVVGRIQTGSYTAKDGTKRYTTDIMVDEFYFAESKKSSDTSNNSKETFTQDDNSSKEDIDFDELSADAFKLDVKEDETEDDMSFMEN